MTALRAGRPFSWGVTSGGPPGGLLKNEAAALMREANEIGSGSGACARQGVGCVGEARLFGVAAHWASAC